MNVTHKFTTDLQTRDTTERIHAMQSDANTRVVEVTLLEGGKEWTPAGATASVAFRNLKDGHKGWYDKLPDGSAACTVSGNVVTAILAPAVLSGDGEVQAAIVFQDANLNQLATFGFSILVEKNPVAGSTIVNDYYAYTTMEAVSEAVDAMLDSLEDAKVQLGQLVNEAVAQVAQEGGPAIVCEASGDVAAVTDAADRPLLGLSLYGKTTQNGTPTPDAPVPLVSAGDGGSIGVQMMGKNLLKYPYADKSGTLYGHTRTVNADGSVTFSGTPTAQANFRFSTKLNLLANVTYTMSVNRGEYATTGTPFLFVYSNTKGVVSQINLALDSAHTFTPVEDVTDASMYIVNTAAGYVTGTVKAQIEVGASATGYEPYKVQSISLPTPNGLLGIPVASGGNYTDSNGQQWICDEIDLARGVYVQRVETFAPTAVYEIKQQSNGTQYAAILATTAYQGVGLLSTHYKGALWNQNDHWCYTYDGGIMVNDNRFTTKAEANAILADEKPVFIYPVLHPVETLLSADTLAAYATLHTNKHHTTVLNDGGAGQKLAYVADTKTYVDHKFTEVRNAIIAAIGTI